MMNENEYIELATPLLHEQCQIKTGQGLPPCSVNWPAWMSKEEYEDLEYWLTRVLIKAKRGIVPGGKKFLPASTKSAE